MQRRAGLPFLLLIAHLATAAAQTPVRAPGSSLHGVVQDSATGDPVAFAQIRVLGTNQQAVSSESGRFTLNNLTSGRARLLVQQIGYGAQTLTLAVDAQPGSGDGGPGLVVRLVRYATILPEISVEGKRCFDLREVGSTAEGGTILTDAFANAKRIQEVEKKYPFILEYQRVSTRLDSGYSLTEGQVDTVQTDTRDYIPYRTGKVLERRLGGKEHLQSFTTSDFAQEEFQRSHCFWYVGRDSVQGFSGYRIDFVPKPEVTSPDWAGSMLVDSASMGLLRTETHLVNLPRKGTAYQRASCTIFYQPIVPSLPQEFQYRCTIALRGGPPGVQVQRWSLINSRFVGKAPAEPEHPD